MNATETADLSIVGQEAHIVAREQNGPRGQSALQDDERDEYNNLILLCSIHHKVIDDHPEAYPIDVLHGFKQDHEQWIKINLQIDNNKNKRDSRYITYLDKIIELAAFDNWQEWTSNLFNPTTGIDVKMYDNLKELCAYLESRSYDDEYKALNIAFKELINIIQDFVVIFGYHASARVVGEEYRTETFYKLAYYPEEVYQSRLRDFQFHICLISDLILELTRSGNRIIDIARELVLPDFRMSEGYLLVRSELNGAPELHTSRFKHDECYPGVQRFMILRDKRDYNCGSGETEQYQFLNQRK